MSRSDHPHPPDDLEQVASILRAHRASSEPLELDQIKQRVLTRQSSSPGRRGSLRSRIAAVLTVAGLVAGSGGALAVAGSGSTGALGSAAIAQYCKDKDHGKCEKHQKKLLHHCKKTHNKSKGCKKERREIRRCHKHHGKSCKKTAGPLRS